jgi:hypothetical protein
MDPITVIVTALATGAAAGLGGTAKNAITDGYSALKTFLKNRYGSVRVETLEEEPASKAKQQMVEEDLQNTGARSDEELLRLAQSVVRLILERAPDTVQAVGLSIEGLEAGELLADNIQSSGPAVVVKDTKVAGKAEFRNLRGGKTSSKG